MDMRRRRRSRIDNKRCGEGSGCNGQRGEGGGGWKAQERRRRVRAVWGNAQGYAIKTIKARRGLKAPTGSNGYKVMRQLGPAAPRRE